jgi:hypothetical protein
MRVDNTSGFKGVTFHRKMKKWVAWIRAGGKNVYLGLHSTPEAAHDAYVKAAVRVYGEFACAG